MKVLMIDPWGINNLNSYTDGLCSSLGNFVELILVTSFAYNTPSKNYKVKKYFFKYSNEMKKGFFRKVIRGIEYLIGNIRLILLIIFNHFDAIHFQWLLYYKVDIITLRILKFKKIKLIYTAHNLLPHINGEKHLKILGKLYGVFDNVIVHGEKLKEKFSKIFPEYCSKVIIQHHGIYANMSTSYDESLLDNDLINIVSKYDKILLFSGFIFYNKGVDILLDIWKEVNKPNVLLIIAGRVNEYYSRLDYSINNSKNLKNLIIIDKYLPENTLNYLMNKSSILILPYRDASMSGVVFTAANFNKTVLSTDVGSIYEYLNENDSFLTDNNYESLKIAIKHVVSDLSKTELVNLGILFGNRIKKEFSWSAITKNLLKEVYCD